MEMTLRESNKYDPDSNSIDQRRKNIDLLDVAEVNNTTLGFCMAEPFFWYSKWAFSFVISRVSLRDQMREPTPTNAVEHLFKTSWWSSGFHTSSWLHWAQICKPTFCELLAGVFCFYNNIWKKNKKED